MKKNRTHLFVTSTSILLLRSITRQQRMKRPPGDRYIYNSTFTLQSTQTCIHLPAHANVYDVCFSHPHAYNVTEVVNCPIKDTAVSPLRSNCADTRNQAMFGFELSY